MEQKKYHSIVRLGHKSTVGVLNEGDEIIVQEKVDGANASFMLHEGELLCFSRNTQLDPSNTLSGFYNWVHENIDPDKLLDGVIYFGEWSCLSGDTEIKLVSGGKRGHKMTLREMYKYATEEVVEYSKFVRKDGKRTATLRKPWWERHGYPQLYSWFEDEDVVKPQRMAKILYTGDKEVYEVVTRKGNTIKATMEHKFLTNNGWKELKDINVGDVVAVTELQNKRGGRSYGKGTRQVKALLSEVRSQPCELCGVNSCIEVHHRDHNWQNNNIDNLQPLCKDCHIQQHKNDGVFTTSNQLFDYEFDRIEAITFVGVEDCYDISMGVGENSSSFVANNFIVHNCTHKIQYPNHTKKFFLFDVYNTHLEEYVNFSMVVDEAMRLGLNLIPVFYRGMYQGYDHLTAFVGMTQLGGILKGKHPETGEMIEKETGEGIVVKNVNYRDRHGKQLFVKLVVDDFREIQKQKAPKDPSKISETRQLVLSCLTPARIEKHLFKLVDEGILSPDYTLKDMGFIIKQLGHVIAQDIIDEELQDYTGDTEVIYKDVAKVFPPMLRNIITNRQ